MYRQTECVRGILRRSRGESLTPYTGLHNRCAGKPASRVGHAVPQQHDSAKPLQPDRAQAGGVLSRQTIAGDNILRNYVRQGPRSIDTDQFLQRIDWNENNRSSWFGRFGWSDESEGLTSAFAFSEGRVVTKVYQTVLSNTRTLGTAAVHEFRFGYNQFRNDKVGYHAFVRDVATELGIPG